MTSQTDSKLFKITWIHNGREGCGWAATLAQAVEITRELKSRGVTYPWIVDLNRKPRGEAASHAC